MENKDIEQEKNGYEFVNHPSHYNKYSLEVIYILERIYGTAAAAQWCEMTAMKYRLRMGTKPGEPIDRDLEKESWYLQKRDELLAKINGNVNEPKPDCDFIKDSSTDEEDNHEGNPVVEKEEDRGTDFFNMVDTRQTETPVIPQFKELV